MPEESLHLHHPYTDGEKRTHPLNFVHTQDRSSPPIFAGRESILARVDRDVARCRANTNSTECFTLVIHGAPGAGKTSLLNEIEKRHTGTADDRKKSQDSVVVVRLLGEMLSIQIDVAEQFIKALLGESSNINGETTTVSCVGRLLGLGARRQRATRVRSLDQPIQSASTLWNAVLENTKVDRESTTFLLLVDEHRVLPGTPQNLITIAL